MQNAIKTEKGFFTIIERYDKGFKIEKFDTNISNPNVIKFNILLAFIDQKTIEKQKIFSENQNHR